VLSLFFASQSQASAAEGVPTWIPGALMAVAVLYFTIWSLKRLSTRARRSTLRTVGPTAFANATARKGLLQQTPDAPEKKAAVTGDPTILRKHLESVMVDVQEVTRLSAAQIENRAAMLDRLVADADHKIAQLESLLAQVNQKQESLLRESRTNAHTARDQPVGQPANDPLSQRVLHMASQGHSPLHIASALGEQVGKVNLILALNASSNSARSVSG